MKTANSREIRHWESMGLDLVTLHVFKAAVEEQSLVRAAERVHLALSSVSRRIAEMEARVGTSLLRRHDRGVEPTAAGRVLMRHLGTLFDLLQHAAVDLEAFAAGRRGYVRLQANPSSVAGMLPEALAQFLHMYPDIEVSVEERMTVEILRAVQVGSADLGLISGTVHDVDVQVLRWRKDHLVAVLPLDHALAVESGPIRFADLAVEPFIAMSSSMALQNVYRREAAALGLTLQERVNVASFDSVRRMVEAGLGVSILPEDGAVPYTRAMRIRVRQLVDPWTTRTLAICLREREALPAAARLLVQHLTGREDL